MQVFVANSGKAAIKIFEETKIDFVLSDIEMDDGNGVDVITYISKKNIAMDGFFFMTGFTERDENELLSLGAEKLFRKPINTRKVIKEFLKLLD